jgi:hypothetical protein
VEATGVYCQPLLAVLEKHGIETRLVKSSSLKAVNEYQKSDMLDCQWIQVLETFGLLRAAFRPSPEISRIRVLSRERRDLIEQATQNINKMNKALTAMNVRLDLAVSDITGQTAYASSTRFCKGSAIPTSSLSFGTTDARRAWRKSPMRSTANTTMLTCSFSRTPSICLTRAVP